MRTFKDLLAVTERVLLLSYGHVASEKVNGMKYRDLRAAKTKFPFQESHYTWTHFQTKRSRYDRPLTKPVNLTFERNQKVILSICNSIDKDH